MKPSPACGRNQIQFISCLSSFSWFVLSSSWQLTSCLFGPYYPAARICREECRPFFRSAGAVLSIA